MNNTSYRHSILSGSLEHNLGSVINGALKDPLVQDIMLNPDGKLWLYRAGKMDCVGELPTEQAQIIVSLMASAVGNTVTIENPIVEAELPMDGSRFEGLSAPVVSKPTFCIRKSASFVFTIGQYVDNGILPLNLQAGLPESTRFVESQDQTSIEISSINFLGNAVADKKNILVVGGTGSGKTTFVNAILMLISQLAAEDRLIIIEDTTEIQSKNANVVPLRTSDFVDFRRLVRASMRLRPDRIVIGEVRDGAALELLKAWNTGHPGGVSTIHANSAYEGLLRLEELISEATPAPKHDLIASTIDIVLFIEEHQGSRRISEIAKVLGYDHQRHTYVLDYWLNRDVAFQLTNKSINNGRSYSSI